MLSRCFWGVSVGVGAFVVGLRQISSFFSGRKRRECSFSLISNSLLSNMNCRLCINLLLCLRCLYSMILKHIPGARALCS